MTKKEAIDTLWRAVEGLYDDVPYGEADENLDDLIELVRRKGDYVLAVLEDAKNYLVGKGEWH